MVSFSQFPTQRTLGASVRWPRLILLDAIRKTFVEWITHRRVLRAQRESLREMKEAKTRAERADRMKSQFIANLSHEIRTSLGAMLGYTELLETEGSSSAERPEFVAGIRRCSEQLLALVNDLLDLAKMEAGQLKIERRPIDTATFLRELENFGESLCRSKGIKFRIEREAQLPRTIVCDPFRLRQVLLNLIHNAVKFTDDGTIVLSTTLQPPQRSRIRFDVSDTGAGIETAFIHRLFQPFSQLERDREKVPGGTGLGLVISRKIARLLGGDLWLVRSEPGVGSTFAVEVASGADATSENCAPCALTAEPEWGGQAEEAVSLAGRRLLVVDDSSDSRGLLSRFLASTGAIVDLAENGFDGVDRALGGKPYDLILMDLQMPRLDGFGALRKLRGRGYSAPIAALTARALREEREQCLASGFDAHLAKPIRRRDLVRVVAEICERERGETSR